MNTRSAVLSASVAALVAGCLPHQPDYSNDIDYRTDYADWPELTSAIEQHPSIEARVRAMVRKMTLEEKVGQMVQPEIQSATPQDVIDYHLGSVLNGGGSWPNNDKYATAQDWVDLADQYYDASMYKKDHHLPIPLIWGTDAVHGHSNVYGTTLFPHNIGLGAANDPDLIRRIGAATAEQVVITGIDWTFAPTLAVVRDDRWGRTYEGYSEDPQIVFNYGGAMVEGLQGDLSDDNVVATAKHFIGDGGTDLGDDQGDTLVSEEELINIHAQGYFSALTAGAQTVIASFNSWQGEKLHGHEYLLNQVLKQKMNFDGFIVSDWNGIGQVVGCTNADCPQAVNAGIDMFMVPNDWKAFIENTIQSVNDGEIAMSRIDDAVTRILRVKMRMGLFDKRPPSDRPNAGDTDALASPEMRALAREAVRKSQVLLKNENGVLPLSKDMNILVTGPSADNLQNQTGGWTLTWQGTGNSNADFPNATSIFDGIVDAADAGTVTLNEDGSQADDSYDVIIAVIGETPYAEGVGDISKFQTMAFADHHPGQSQLLDDLRTAAPGTPIVTLYVGGRPLWMNPELNDSDAFVASWLPGTEGGGVADVLFGDHAFTGALSYSWPAEDCQVPVNRDDGQAPLFPYGFGLTTADDGSLPVLPEDRSDKGCDAPDTGDDTTEEPLDIFTNGANQGDYVLRIGGPSNWGGMDVNMDPAATTSLPGGEVTVTTEDGATQFSAKRFDWATIGQMYSQTADAGTGDNLAAYANSETSIRFRVKVNEAPASSVVNMAVHCVYPCAAELNIASLLGSLPVGEWTEMSVPLQCFMDKGLDITNVNTPFLIFTDGAMDLSIENVHWAPFTAGPNPDCSAITEPAPVIDTDTDVYIDGIADTDLFKQPGKWAADTTTWVEDPSFITLDAAHDDGTSLVVDAQYGDSSVHKGVVFFQTTQATDLSPIAATGRIQFDLKVVDLAGASGMVGKAVCSNDANGCTTGDLPLDISVGNWVTNEINLADFPGFNWAEVTSVLELLPVWDSNHANVHYQIDNVRILAN
ncbi:glycoside hydrolase family 3 protein [Saccharospirillum salsuginis]|uniref:Beta-glucosidase n=1 Tax=Saccharospirillum salsuginis TaxID=418750 RepID=A0A918NFH4_9GAMM|nr:glycoside hydrolase family 3 N-terminal domain-containing protein [Saccharospirillum salsuginis]GGX69068.1 beta-glucosidase [Saccharospirillum salsuginis]